MAVLPEPARSWAVGLLMAIPPGPVRLAEEALSAAAARAGLSEVEVAQAIGAGSRGTLMPPDTAHALDDAVRAGRRPTLEFPRSGPVLMSTREDVDKALARFFEARVRLCAAPQDSEARQAVDDAVYRLCVVMAQPSLHAAVNEAVQYTNG
ncbi:DUF5133 domain-containing protein [Streptomyces xanthophaeus]